MLNIEIDGQKLQAEQGAMIIEIADHAGIAIPRFCYHKKLSVAANCRMCLVDVEKAPKAVPACATPVTEGMIVRTKSAKALDAQKSVMEFLLINHPLDCPICDQGGECELQDISVGYGKDISKFAEGKRVVKDKDIGPLIATEMTRCIHCTRCVRFGTEIAGMREMGATGRGEHMEIGTFIAKSVDSEVSGNVIDLCPVGALTAKPSRFAARAWELQARPSVAPHDCLGSNIDVHVRRNQVMRVVPRENESINEVWIADRDRFSYEALNNASRLTQPRIKRDGKWQDASWSEALEIVATKLQQYGAQVAALASSSNTTEELYLLQKLIRGFGSNNIDVRLRQRDFSADAQSPLYPSLGMPIADLETRDATLLVGSNLRKEQPIASLRLRKSTRHGAVISVAPQAYDHNFKCAEDIVGSDWVQQLAAIAKAMIAGGAAAPADATALLQNVSVNEQHKRAADLLLKAEQKAVVLGAAAQEHRNAATIQALAQLIAQLSGASFGTLTAGANMAGAYLAGAIPFRREAGHRSNSGMGMNAQQMLTQGAKAFVLLDVEPEFDSVAGAAAKDAIGKAEFIVALTPWADHSASAYADVLLPIAAFTETSGTFVNVEGTFQSFAAAVSAPGETRPAWKVLRVLGNLSMQNGFEYGSTEDVLNELEHALDHSADVNGAWQAPATLSVASDLSGSGIYRVDALVRRAGSLQQTTDATSATQNAAPQNTARGA